jgi:predicted  nucleic acid-binding Zn-ribbon protein
VHSELEQLLVLQDRQQKIRQIQAEIKTVPLERAHLESQLAASAAGVESLKQKARQVEVGRKNLELDVGTRTESIARLKTQQYQTRKNDEFQAIGHEIERYENEIRKLEDQELELMIEADKLKGKGDAAVVAVEHGVCTGCHMKVTTATASRVKAGKEIVSCENCGRILYLGA